MVSPFFLANFRVELRSPQQEKERLDAPAESHEPGKDADNDVRLPLFAPRISRNHSARKRHHTMNIDSHASVPQLDDYVLIEKEDVIEALAVFVARYVVSLPQAQDMEPKVTGEFPFADAVLAPFSLLPF